jgi:AraC family transcriptional regulator
MYTSAFGGVFAGKFRLPEDRPGEARGGLAPWQLRRVNDFVDANLDGDPSIARLAGECGLSVSHFARAFKQAVGLPPHQWLTKRRVDRARELLLDSGVELAEIALTCGFVDQSHLTRVFSRAEGCSPGRWRRHQLQSPSGVSRGRQINEHHATG